MTLPDVRIPPSILALREEIPHLDQYFGMWAIHEERFRAMVESVRGVDLATHVAAAVKPEAAVSGEGYAITKGGVAIIDIAGPMMKFKGSLQAGTSTVQVRRQLRAAANNDDVEAIVLRIDSPGGTVAGTSDLAEDVAAINRIKPVAAFIEDIGASAAYWVASQARKVYANKMALVGSIGTFAVLYDMSIAAAQMGVKVHVIRAGAMKGAGTPGTEITQAQLEEFQRLVDGMNSFFLDGVAAGRRLPRTQVEAMADGRVHVGEAAVSMRLVDEISTFDEVIGRMGRTSTGKQAKSTGDVPMSEAAVTAPAAVAATMAELKNACPGATAEWLVAQAEKGATVPQAKDAFLSFLSEQNQKLAAEAQEAKAAAKPAESAKPRKAEGVEPVGTRTQGGGTQASGSALDEWNEKVEAYRAQGLSYSEARIRVNRENPGLRERIHAETNG